MDPHANKPTSGPLSRAWPQLFKKRRRHSPARDVTAENPSDLSSTSPPQKIPIRKTSAVAANDASAGNSHADLLASKSNYEWIAEGRHAEMGLHFSTAMSTGVMMKRATHRQAEQARRDRMKTAMVDLAEFMLDGKVTFGSGTNYFVVKKGDEGGDGKGGERKSSVNKARLIEMALEKMKSQEEEIDLLTERLKDCRCRMDTE